MQALYRYEAMLIDAHCSILGEDYSYCITRLGKILCDSGLARAGWRLS